MSLPTRSCPRSEAPPTSSDRRIEYSELAAFLGAANRGVLDPRARPGTLVRAPERYPHAAVVALTGSDRTSALVGRPAPLGPIYIEDARGNRLASVNAEPGHRVELLLPAGVDLFVRGPEVEAAMVIGARTPRRFEDLVFRPQQADGAVREDLHAGQRSLPDVRGAGHRQRGGCDRQRGGGVVAVAEMRQRRATGT